MFSNTFTSVLGLGIGLGLALGHTTQEQNRDTRASELVARSVAALGGEDVLSGLSGIVYHSPKCVLHEPNSPTPLGPSSAVSELGFNSKQQCV